MGGGDTPPVRRVRSLPLISLAIGGLLHSTTGCRSGGRSGGPAAADRFADSATGVSRAASGSSAACDADSSPSAEPASIDAPVAEVEPGPYATDDRFLGLAASFADRVRAAADRLELATGLAFRDRAAPRVLLTSLRDESKAFRLTSEIVAGRRRMLLLVNAEPLVAGTENPDRVLLRGLAAAALEGTSRKRSLPGWFSVYAGLLASGDSADRVISLARARVRGESLPRVDPLDPAAADATGLAVSLLLATRSTPAAVRHWLDLVADGDDPTTSLPKLLDESAGEWPAAARRALDDAVSDADADESAEKRLLEARKASEELGPEGLAESLDAGASVSELPDWFFVEADALRLASAIRSGDLLRARLVLERRPPEAATLGRLRDPGSYLLDAAEAELRDGGNALVAWERLVRFDRDFPKHRARAEAFDGMLSLMGKLPPDLDLQLMERVVKERGTAAIDAKTASRRVEALLADDRPGAAVRFLAALGARGDSGDLADVSVAVLEASEHPTPAALEVHRRRAAAWVARPSQATENDVLDGGAPSAEAVGALLPSLPAAARRDSIRLLVRAGGLARAIQILLPAWDHDSSRRSADLSLLAAEVGYADLRRTVAALDLTPPEDPAVFAAWQAATFGLDPEILAADDLLLTRLQNPDFSIRRKAFEDLVSDEGASASPALVRHMASDPATLLRRRAVLAAGRIGLVDVARTAFDDPSWIVRSAAASALAEAKDDGAVERLEAAAAGAEPDIRVRAAAAAALLRFAERGAARFRPIVALLRDDDPTLADAVARALAPESSPGLGRAIASELAAEALGRDARMDRAALFRLFVAYRRATGRDAGYDPSLEPAQVRALVASLPEIRSARGDGSPR